MEGALRKKHAQKEVENKKTPIAYSIDVFIHSSSVCCFTVFHFQKRRSSRAEKEFFPYGHACQRGHVSNAKTP